MRPIILVCISLVWPSHCCCEEESLVVLGNTNAACWENLCGSSNWVIAEVQFYSQFHYLLMPAWSCSPLKCCCWGQVGSFAGFWRGLLSPVVFGYALAACVLAGSRTVLCCSCSNTQNSISSCQIWPCSLVLSCIYLSLSSESSLGSGLPLGVWGVAGAVADQLLRGRVVWELDQSSHPSACDGSPGDLSFLSSPSFPPLGNACVNLSNFPISASTVLPFGGSYWVVVTILLQLPQARTLKPAASSDVKKGLCAQGTSFAVIACGLRSILPPCKSCFSCYLDKKSCVSSGLSHQPAPAKQTLPLAQSQE